MQYVSPLFSKYEDPTASLERRTTDNQSADDQLKICWGHNSCWDCLDQRPCSWCPFTSACVPNTNQLHILAPISNPDICPIWSERWELRTRPLGCHVSTLTFLTSVVTIFTTFLVIGAVAGIIVAVRFIHRQWKVRSEGWWKIWKRFRSPWFFLSLNEVNDRVAEEARLLLGEQSSVPNLNPS